MLQLRLRHCSQTGAEDPHSISYMLGLTTILWLQCIHQGSHQNIFVKYAEEGRAYIPQGSEIQRKTQLHYSVDSFKQTSQRIYAHVWKPHTHTKDAGMSFPVFDTAYRIWLEHKETPSPFFRSHFIFS